MRTSGNASKSHISARLNSSRFSRSSRRRLGYFSAAIILLAVAVSALVPRSSALTNNGNITAFETPLTENFDTLASVGTNIVWTDNSTIPGWYASRVTYNSGTGSSNTGALYSFGTAAAADRALGSVASGGTGTVTYGVKLTNSTGSTITSVDISYIGEQWRNGGNTTAHSLQFQYQVANAGTIPNINAGTWTALSALDFTSLVNTATGAALDGNNAANRTAKSAGLSVSVNSGQEIWFRWVDVDDSGADHGLAVDNFSVTAHGAGPTNPTGLGAANPSSVPAGDSTLLTVNVTPGTGPISTGLAVRGDLSPIGGSATQQFFDDGTHGDVTPADNIFSFFATVAGGTSGGAKILNTTVSDAQARSSSAPISLTVLVPTSPTGTGAANPNPVQAGNSSLLTVAVTPGANPTSTGLTVTGDLSSIGGSATQTFFDNGTNGDVTPGDNTFSFNATVAVATPTGLKTLPIQIADAEARTGSTSISLSVQVAPPPAGSVVISQVYGGGGNAGATIRNDFIEVFNRSANPIDLTGWSVQYSSAAGTTWQRTPLTSVILQPGQYYLVQEAAGAGGSTDLPTPDAIGTIPMGATSAKVALVSSNGGLALSGSCPSADPNLMDLVGYGTPSCFEGAAPAPTLSNTTAAIRARSGCKDTDYNFANFTEVAPSPRNTSTAIHLCPAGDEAPEIFSTTPADGSISNPLNTNITLDFDQPVNVVGSWFQVSCTTSGLHTATVTGGPTSFTLDPDSDFAGHEQCTVTVFASQVTDVDTDDPPDNMAADFVFDFNTLIPRDPAEHMVMGNPTGAVIDESFPTNYLLLKDQFGMSYNRDRGGPNWVSWHLDNSWLGSAPRQDDFRDDDTLPIGWYHVLGTDFSGSGFDRGHMCPSADRTSTIPDNSATFLMTNMLPQAPDNNQGPWAEFENYLRTLIGPGNELYIVSGGQGIGGIGSGGPHDTIAVGNVTVPAQTWKVVMVLPNADGDDVARVNSSTRTIAIIMPNVQGIRTDDWQKYLATVDQVEALTGDDFFSNVAPDTQAPVESKLDAENDTAPVTVGQTTTVPEDGSVGVTLTATDFNINNVFTFGVVDQPQHGAISGSGANLTYSPNPNYFGPDSFTFKANDGALDSNISTVTITVTEGVPVISASGSALASESCPPFNGAIDPGERVTVSLQVANSGNHVTSNLVATLQTLGGVIVPSVPQSYGAIAPSTSATRDFSFTATGTCGGTLTATLQLQDGSTNLGTVSYNFTLGVDSGGGFVCTAGCGGVRLLVTSAVNRTGASTVQATITVQNIGSDQASNAVLTTAKLSSINGTSLPQNLGNIAPGGSATTQVNFTNSTPGASSTLVVGGTYTGGNFSSTKRLTIP